MTPPRSAFGHVGPVARLLDRHDPSSGRIVSGLGPQGGAPSGPAEPDPRRPLGRGRLLGLLKSPDNMMRLTIAMAALAASTALWWPIPAEANVRIKELAAVQGVRSNQLLGYGLVVGLDGTGDQATQSPNTTQSLQSLLQQLGVTLPAGTSLSPRNVAAVLVTAQLPPFAQPGQTIDVTVSSMGNAKSLRGGTLIATPLRGADGQIYALAQGNLLVGGAGASAGGSKVQINHLSAGRIPEGASVERSVPTPLLDGEALTLGVNASDYATAAAIAEAINRHHGDDTATPLDGRSVRVKMPAQPGARLAFLAAIENLTVQLAQPAARVVLNARTGSVIVNDAVTLGPCAVAHGNLSVTISTTPVVSQPNALAGGQTVQTEKSDIAISQQGGALIALPAGAKLADVVKALNSLGATPMDLLAILQAMKTAGALRAEIEVI